MVVSYYGSNNIMLKNSTIKRTEKKLQNSGSMESFFLPFFILMWYYNSLSIHFNTHTHTLNWRTGKFIPKKAKVEWTGN